MCPLLAGDDAFSTGVSAHVEDVGAAEGDEFLFGYAATRAALAVQQEDLVLVFDAAGPIGFDLIDGKIDGDLQMTSNELAGCAHVDDLGSLLQVGLVRL